MKKIMPVQTKTGYSALLVLLFTLPVLFSYRGLSQNLPIGHRTMNFTDPDRNNRPVPSEIYYPAATPGENTPVATGIFPVVVFGHGYQMGYDSYLYFRDAIVPDGYIVVYPKTESSLFPSHSTFGADLAFLVVKMQSEGSTPGSPFFAHIDSASAIMGHSMGGGASFLACKNNSTPTTMVTWAAAETNPSAIAAARQVTIPALVFAADKDCVTPPSGNQIPMYDSLGSACKVYINIKGGGHCYFADPNFICQLGEAGCPPFTITRDQQHATTIDFTKMYLDYRLKGNQQAWIAFNDSLETSPRITFMKSCTTTAIDPGIKDTPVRIIPNPVTGIASVVGLDSPERLLSCSIVDIYGKPLKTEIPDGFIPGKMMLPDMTDFKAGMYFVSIITDRDKIILKLIKE